MSDAVEPLDVGAIRERVEAATDGPWRTWVSASDSARDSAVETAWTYDSDGDTELITDYMTAPDARFVATARQDVPALLAEVERLRAALTTARRGALTEAADWLEAMVSDDGPGNRNTGYGQAGLHIIARLRARAAQEEGR